MIDFISSAIGALDYQKISSYVLICYFSAMIVVAGLNVKDALRIWIVGVLLLLSAIDMFLLRQYLPDSLVIRQIAYTISDVLALFLLKYRLRLGARISATFCREDSNSYLYRVCTDLGYAKQEWFLRNMLVFSALGNLALILEHIIRNPHLIGLSRELGYYSIFVYELYPFYKLGLVIAVTLALLTMTVDGFVVRYLKINPFKNGE
jgi:hypothetical protein